MIDRRKFVGALAGGLAIARSIAEAQPAAKVYRVGFVLGATRESAASLCNALDEGLRELGYVEGCCRSRLVFPHLRNVNLGSRWCASFRRSRDLCSASHQVAMKIRLLLAVMAIVLGAGSALVVMNNVGQTSR